MTINTKAIRAAANFSDKQCGRLELDTSAIIALLDRLEAAEKALAEPAVEPTYTSTQATTCASCGEHKHTPLRIDQMGGYVCLTCIDQRLGSLLGEFGYPEETSAVEPVAWRGRMLAEEEWTLYVIDPTGAQGVEVVEPLYTSPPPPAEVPLLTPYELEALEVRHRPADGPKSTLNFARAIENAVRQKAGLQ